MPLATPTRRMPVPEEIREFFGDLLGKGVSVEKRAEFDFNDENLVAVSAVFVEDDGTVGGACVADLPLSAYAGAALAMVPKPVAEESVKAGGLEDSLKDNYHEVANILTAVLNGPSVPHLKIRELSEGVPDEIKDLVVKAAGRRTFDVTITDYGSGQLALYAR